MTAPPSSADRIVALDVIRGIAVIGILLLNIVVFAMPGGAALNPFAYGGDGPLDIAIWGTNFVLADGKFRALFTMLFGASLLLIADRAEAAGENPALVSYSRLSWLLLFGAIHAYAIWQGDILMLYAAIGMAAYLLRGLALHQLAIGGLCLVVAQAVWFGVDWIALNHFAMIASQPGSPTDIATDWHAMETAFAPSAQAIGEDLALYRGGYAEILAHRLGPEFWRPIDANFSWTLDTLGLMLLGMAGLKSGFLTGEWTARSYARVAGCIYLVTVPAMIALALWTLARGFDLLTVELGYFVIKPLIDPWMAAAHAALILGWLAGRATRLQARFAAAGRMAFTNYIATSLICTMLFYGYGLGLYGHLDRAALYLVVAGIGALILLWSKAWLERYRYGPLEWLWRSAARRRWQPMRR